MNYRLIQHYVTKFPPKYRSDLFQEGCLAVLVEKDIYHHMIDWLRWWTKYRRKDTEKQFIYEDDSNLRFEYDPVEDIYLKEMLPRLNRSILKLKPKWQKIVHWRYWEGLSMKEIGEVTKTSESNISRLNSKILKNLRTALK